ncbi:FecCD family ABC transporter permease [Butyrivibrio sp. MC2013]|uniref:FecCD family ABC transporter permease n=1 Tax=Butyrivibrio sp. MC2013 TaxID=1280686 RepID=UPI00047A7246|nr:iron ABC transporter permease [Butyrivibrio sp. MC2013]
MKSKKRNIETPLITALGAVILVIALIFSIMVGSRYIPLRDLITVISGGDADPLYMPILQKRLLRTVIGLLSGAALGISGSLMQSVTRNPIADPSILGVNTGASLAVVSAIAFLGISRPGQYIFFALLGAMIAAFIVFGITEIASAGVSSSSDPIRLALAGACVSIACSSLISTVMLPRTNVMQVFRFWQTGSIGGGSWQSVGLVAPLLFIGLCMALLLIPSLNVLALGDELATGLGVNVKRTRILASLCAVLLCGAVTSVTGPIGFVGLMVPHMVRIFCGSDMKKLIPLSAVYGACLLLIADIVGRVIARPSEMEVGIVTAFIGAPVFIMIIRHSRMSN